MLSRDGQRKDAPVHGLGLEVTFTPLAADVLGKKDQESLWKGGVRKRNVGKTISCYFLLRFAFGGDRKLLLAMGCW